MQISPEHILSSGNTRNTRMIEKCKITAFIYIEREKATPHMAVTLIASTGGIPVLAHPMLYHLGDALLSELIQALKPHGLMGMESVQTSVCSI